MIYLLDTNILLAYLREPNTIQEFIDKKYAPLNSTNKAVISIVTIGEIKSLSIKNNWGENKIAKIEKTLEKLIISDINDEEILDRYAKLMLSVRDD